MAVAAADGIEVAGVATATIHMHRNGRHRPSNRSNRQFEQVMAPVRVPRPIGRPRVRPDAVLADKAYSSRAIRDPLQRRGIRTVIPVPADQQAHRQRRGSHGG
ncbi:hypothetical protein GCM10020000_83080 [Streptomyces olivoverticillatus]